MAIDEAYVSTLPTLASPWEPSDRVAIDSTHFYLLNANGVFATVTYVAQNVLEFLRNRDRKESLKLRGGIIWMSSYGKAVSIRPSNQRSMNDEVILDRTRLIHFIEETSAQQS